MVEALGLGPFGSLFNLALRDPKAYTGPWGFRIPFATLDVFCKQCKSKHILVVQYKLQAAKSNKLLKRIISGFLFIMLVFKHSNLRNTFFWQNLEN